MSPQAADLQRATLNYERAQAVYNEATKPATDAHTLFLAHYNTGFDADYAQGNAQALKCANPGRSPRKWRGFWRARTSPICRTRWRRCSRG